MSTVWVVSAVLCWAVVALLVAVVLSLLRQTAELRLRLDELDGGEAFEAPDDDARLHDLVAAAAVPTVGRPDRDHARGIAVGDARGADAAEDGDADAGTIVLGGLQDRPALLVFHSPGCVGCVGLEEAVAALAAEDPAARVVSVLALREDDAAAHAADHPLPGVPTVSVDRLPPALRRPTTPSMLGLSRDGSIALLGRPTGLDDLRRAAQATAEA